MKFTVYNRQLNPLLWDNDKLIPQVRINLLKIAEDFYKETLLSAPIFDIQIIGSAANYNWTSVSDIDLHILIDFKNIGDGEEQVKQSVDAFKDNWNLKHNVFIKTHKVELYIQSLTEINRSESSFSLIRNEWIVPPIYNPPHLDKPAIRAKYAELVRLINSVISTNNTSDLRRVMEHIKTVRSDGLQTGGEFSTENLVFKLLRNRGHIKRLKDALISTYDKSVSLTESADSHLAHKYAAKIITMIWRTVPEIRSDPYNSSDLLLYVDNELKINDQAHLYARELYPTETEPIINFSDDIRNTLAKMEDLHYARRRTRKVSAPMDVLRDIVRNKSWKQAKRELLKHSLGYLSHQPLPREIEDSEAEQVFNRHYRIANGETMYNKPTNVPRLSELVRQESSSTEAYNDNLMITHYVGQSATKFPDQVVVYRGVNSNVADIRPGDFVTLDRDYARSYIRGKFGMIKSTKLNSADLFVIRADPGGTGLLYWPEGHSIKTIDDVPSFRDFWLTNAHP